MIKPDATDLGDVTSSASDSLQSAIADAQALVGQFLMQKQRILNLPSGNVRETLLNVQTKIEGQAPGIIAKAQSIQTALSQKFDPFKIASYTALGPALKSAGQIVPQVAQMTQAIKAHIANVDAAAQGQPIDAAGPETPVSLTPAALIVGALVLGGVAYKMGFLKRRGA